MFNLAKIMLVMDLLLWSASGELDGSYQISNSTMPNDTEIDIEGTLSTDSPPLINIESNATESNGTDQPSDDVTTEEQIIPEEKSDYVTLEQLTTTESVWASSTGKDYTITDFVDNYETTEGPTTRESQEWTTNEIESTVYEEKSTTENNPIKYSIGNLSSSSGKSFINASLAEDKFVRISFVTNRPQYSKITTQKSPTISDEDADRIFKFWTSLSVKNEAFKEPEVNAETERPHDHLVTIVPTQNPIKKNATKPCNQSDFAKTGYDLDLEINKDDSEDSTAGYDTTNLSDDEVTALEAADYGLKKMQELYDVEEPKLYDMGLWLEADNPARYVATFNWQSEEARKYAKYGYASLQASARLKQKLEDELESREDVPERKSNPPRLSSLKQSPLRNQCPLRGTPRCPPASKRYRTHDGTCNNPRRGRWGSALTPVERFLPPQYEDEVNLARGADVGLPSPRLISSRVHIGRRRDAPAISHLLMQWGQFIDHDITSSSQARAFNGSIPRCCLDGGRHFVPRNFLHPDCMPIEVPEDDPFYGPLGIRCLEFVRSSPAPRVDCEFGWREQMNQVTAYIDASPIYSSSARQADKLRLFRNGLLQYGRAQARRPLLPPREDDEEALCLGGAVDASCFKAGDGRVNEHPGLVATHIIWLRKHNRLATELGHLNPHWSDEKIYQETRKIIGAFIQHITYKEFLPIILGSEVMKLFDLELVKKGYYSGYSAKVNPSPANAFGAAAFRFGHSLVQDSFMRYDRFHRPLANNVSLHDELSNPSNIWSFGAVDRLVLGMCNQPSQKRDEFITPELINHLFQTPRFGFGMDLAAINIQRGRDHGLPPYVEWREPCGLTPVNEWSDLFKVMQSNTIRNLQDVYRTVYEIDLFTGGMSERPVVEGLVGPTFACIIAQQFSNLRRGDRFWYENGGQESSFTPAQLQQIRRVTFAQILCQTLESIDTIQPFVFLTSDDFRNERIPCTSSVMNNFDLTPWTEKESEDNDVNAFDRTNFVKSSSAQPQPTVFENQRTSTGNSLTDNIDQKIKIDDKLDLPERSTTTTTTTTVKPTRKFLSALHSLFQMRQTTENTPKLDDKLDPLFTENVQHKTVEKTDNTLPAEERRSFTSEEIPQNLTETNRALNSTNSTKNKGAEKTYGFLLDEDSNIPFLGNIFNRWKTTTTKKPQIYLQTYDTYTTNTPNKFTYLINIVPKTTPKPEEEVVKITVQGPTSSKTKPQYSSFPYDKRPVYENNVLEYRPPNSFYQNSQSHAYNRPLSQQDYFTDEYSYNRPYKPNKPLNSYPYTTEYNPYSLVTFNHVETTKRYNTYLSDSQNTYQSNYGSVVNKRPTRPTRPTITNYVSDDFVQNPNPISTDRPSGTGITIFIENKPSRPKPVSSPTFSTNSGYNSFSHVQSTTSHSAYPNSDETVPLFSRPSYQKPLLNRPLTNERPYNYYKPQPSSVTTYDDVSAYDVPLLSEHGQFSHSNRYPYPQNDLYNKKTTVHPLTHVSPTNLNINLGGQSGNQHHSDLSIVIDSNLRNKDSKPNRHGSFTTAKTPVKYYYIGNVLHKYPADFEKEQKTVTKPNHSHLNKILRENYNNVWKPNKEEHELYYDPSEGPYDEANEPVDSEEDGVQFKHSPLSNKMKDMSESRDNQRSKDDTPTMKRETVVKPKPPQKLKDSERVFFDVIPSENSPTTWMVYNESPEISDGSFNIMPKLASDPNSSKELPRPISFMNKKFNERRH